MNEKPIAGVSLNAGPNSGALNFPMEHLPLVCNSLLCERLLGFERELVTDEGGTRFEWSGQGLNGEASSRLFDFFNTDPLALELLRMFCDSNELGYNLIHPPKQLAKLPYQCFLLGADTEGKPVQRASTQGNRIGPVTCLVMLGFMQVDLIAQHKLLYPGHYMALSS